jgi:hypothetical protein
MGNVQAGPSKCAQNLLSHNVSQLISWPAVIRIRDLDNMQCLIKTGRRLPPFRSIEGEDRVNRHVSDRGSMSVPRIQPCPATARDSRQIRMSARADHVGQ